MTVKMGGPMPPMGGMPANPAMLNPLSPPMPVPPMGQPMMPPQPMPIQQGAAPVAPQARSNAGRRKRFGDTLETMLSSGRQPVASDQMAGMNVFTGQMPRRQMMGGTAMQPPVRRMMGGGSVPLPRQTDIYGQDHMLAYIRPDEADLLMGLGGAGTPGPGGVPQFGIRDFFSSIFGGGKSSNKTSTSTSNANKAFADSMKAGGGGTNLSGSGSSAMADLVAAQQAQTQKDSSPSYFGDITPPDTGGGGSYFNDITPTPTPPPSRPTPTPPPTYGIPGNTEGDPFDRPPNTGVVGGYDPIGGGSVDDVGIGAPPNTGVIGGYDPIGGGSVDDVGIGAPISPGDNNTSPNDPEPIIPTPGTGGGDDTDTGVNLDPVYYDMFGNAYKTQAEAAAADAEYLRKQQAAADAEAERKRMEQFAQLEAQAAADAERAQAERERIARLAAAEAEMGLGPFGGTGGPDDSSYVSDVFEYIPDYKDPRGDEANVMTNYLPDDLINEGLGKGVSLDKKVKDGGEEEEDKSFIDQFKDDAKEFGTSLVNDIQMGIAAGLFGSRATRFKRLRDAGYSKEQANDFLDRSEQTMKDMMDKQAQQSAQDDDGGSAPIIDPCPEGMRLDPVAGICVPIEEEDETEEDDTTEEDTSDDELSGVVTTPPPPTSYLDNPIRMNRGGSVGLNRAADNFLAAMGG